MQHDKLIESLERLEIDGEDLRLVRNLHYDKKAAIRIQGELGKWVNNRKECDKICSTCKARKLSVKLGHASELIWWEQTPTT